MPGAGDGEDEYRNGEEGAKSSSIGSPQQTGRAARDAESMGVHGTGIGAALGRHVVGPGQGGNGWESARRGSGGEGSRQGLSDPLLERPISC